MNATEALQLTRYVQACCPAQKIDEYTPDVWRDVLADVTYDDARAAVVAIARSADTRPLWIDPRQGLNQVRRARAARLDRAELTGAPADPDAYREWLKSTRQQIASGNQTDTPALECPPDAQKRPSDATETRSRVDRRAQLREAIRRASSATEI